MEKHVIFQWSNRWLKQRGKSLKHPLCYHPTTQQASTGVACDVQGGCFKPSQHEPFFAMKKTWSVSCYTHSSVETVEGTLLPKCPRSNLLSPSTIPYPACLPWLHPIIFEFRKNCEPIWATKLRKHNELSCNVSSKSGILWNIIHCYAK